MYTMWVIFPENDQMIMSVLYHSDTLSWQTLRQPVIVLTSVLTTAASLFLKVTFLQSLVSISSVICKRRLKCIYSKRMQITMLTTDRQTQSDDNTLQCISMYLWSSWANRLNLRINNMQIYYEFSLLHIFSLVLQPWMSAYIRKTDGVYISVPNND
jgi:hypothetical protein